MGFALRPALPDFCEEFLLVLFHEPDQRSVFGLLVAARPKNHFCQHWRKINSLWRELVNQLSPI